MNSTTTQTFFSVAKQQNKTYCDVYLSDMACTTQFDNN